jgi:hypothetical protein
MKRATIAALAILCSTSFALAGPGAPPPEGSQKEPPSGRPGKVLSEAECTKAWETAGPDGDTLSKDKAAPYILNFQMVDTSNDAKISQDEWKAGCEKGWVSADAATAKDMKGTPAEPKTMNESSTE